MAHLADTAGRSGLFTDGDWILSKNMTPDGAIGVIQLKHVGVGEFLHKDFQFISDETFKSLGCTEVHPGDILISRMAEPIGRACVVPRLPFRLVTAVDVSILRVDEAFADRWFVAHLCNSPAVRGQVERLARGTTRSRITRTELGALSVQLPALKEQRRIASRLGIADRLRRVRHNALEMSEELLGAVFLEMFWDPARKSDRKWTPCTIEDLCSIIVDCPHSTPEYSPHRTQYPCIRSSDLQRGQLDFSTTRYVDYENYVRRVSRLVPEPGDIVYCREGERFGNAAAIKPGQTPCLGQRVMLLRPKDGVAESTFLLSFLMSESCMRQAQKVVLGTTSPHINVADVVSFRTAIPPMALQKRFSSVAASIEKQVLQCREALRQAEHLFHALLREALG